MLESVKELQSQGEKVTDILIREGHAFSVGVLKHFFNVPYMRLKERGVDVERISRRDVKSLAADLLALKLSLFQVSRDERQRAEALI